MLDFLFGQKVVTITRTTTRITETKKVNSVSQDLLDYHNGLITKDEFNRRRPKLALK